MTTLDWISVVALSSTILFCVLGLWSILVAFKMSKQLKMVKDKPTQTKRQRRRKRRNIATLQTKKKKVLIRTVLLFILAAGACAGAVYAWHYQGTTLGTDDQQAIVEGYYYVREIEAQAATIDQDDAEKKINNIKNIATRLAAFSIKQADGRMDLNNQLLVNRYYGSLNELGINLARQNDEYFLTEAGLTEFQGDLERVKRIERNVFSTFEINEASLANKD